MMDASVSVNIAIVVPLVIALVEIAKKIGLSSTYAPLLSVLLAVALYALRTLSIGIDLIIPGLIAGLTASGVYSGASTTIKAVNKSNSSS